MAINFVLRFEEKDQRFVADFERSEHGFVANLGEVVNTGHFPPYEGDYEVTPKIVAQTLETANKSLESDVTIHAIPYYEVDNVFKGQTVIIGGN